jgi:hypothetical protein
LLAPEIDFVPQQSAHFIKRVGDQMGGETVAMMPVAEVTCQPLKIIHVFGEVLGNVRLQYLEDAALAASRIRIAPREAHHGTHTCFFQYRARDLDVIGLNLRTQFLLYDRADIIRVHVADAVLQFG